MKKQYIMPCVTTETIETEQLFLAGSIISNISEGSTNISYGGGGSGPANSREYDEFADEIGELCNLIIGE